MGLRNKMIESMHIFNFQSHKETFLAFHEGVNVIIGASDQGKTSIIRALNWCLNNKPNDPETIRSDWGGDTEVTVNFSDGFSIRRLKTASKNEYFLLNEGWDEQKFKSFRKDVPEEIKDVVNLSYLNWQGQLDKPFLVSSNAGEVARTLNDVVDLTVIDQSVSNILSDVRKSTSDMKAKQGQLQDLETTLHDLAYLDDLEDDIKDMEELDKKITKDSVSITQMKQHLLKARQAEVIMMETKPDPKNEQLLDACFKVQKKVQKDQEDIEDLTDLLNKMEDCQDQMKDLGYDPAEVLPMINEALDEHHRLQEQKQDIIQLQQLLKKLKAAKQEMDDTEESLQIHEEEFHELMPDECPLCGKDAD